MSLKILVAEPGPHFSVADVCDGLVKGLRACGAEVGRLRLEDRLAFYMGAHVKVDDEYVLALEENAAVKMAAKGLSSMAYEWWPDIVLIVSGFYIPPETWAVLARRPHHVVYWCTESPYEDDRQATPAQYADTVILNDPLHVESYRADVNPRTFYMPHSYDPDRHHPGPADPDPAFSSDFAFVGTGFPSRVEFFEQVDWSGIDAVFGGNWQMVEEDSPMFPLLLNGRTECLDNADAARVYRSAKVTANLYRKETSEEGSANGWAMGPREVELAACGSFFLREPRPEGDALFPMLPTFTTPAEFEDLLRWWLAHPMERETAAALARKAIVDRTFENTAGALLRLVEGHVKTMR